MATGGIHIFYLYDKCKYLSLSIICVCKYVVFFPVCIFYIYMQLCTHELKYGIRKKQQITISKLDDRQIKICVMTFKSQVSSTSYVFAKINIIS